MKKVLSLVLAAVMILTLTCCGQNTPTTTESKSSPASTAAKEEWNPKQINLVIPYKAGGGMENMRTFAKYWEKHLGCEIVVDNRPGANGQVGTSHYTTLAADGTNILANAELYFSYSVVVQGADYKPEDFAFLNLHEVDPCCILLGAGATFKDFKELNDYVLANPGKVRLGCATGGSTMVLAEIIKEKLGWDVKSVLYDGGSDLKAAFLGGHVDIAMSTISTANEAGSKVVLVDSDKPVINHEDAALTADVLGSAPGLGSLRWFAVSKGVKENYPERYEKLLKTMEETYKDPEYLKEVAALNKQDFISYSGPEHATEVVNANYKLAEQYKDALTATAGK